MKFRAVFIFFFQVLIFCSCIKVNGQTDYYVKTFTTGNGLPHNNVVSIAQDQNGFLWIATWDGLSRWDGYEFKNYYHNPADTNSIAYFQTEKVLVDFQNNVWVTCFAGISKYNRNTDNFTQINKGRIGGIATDNDGKFWFNSENGLFRLNYETRSFEIVPLIMDSLQNQKFGFNPGLIEFDNENQLWIIDRNQSILRLFRCNQYNSMEFTATFIGELDIDEYVRELNNYNSEYRIFASQEGDFLVQHNRGIFQLDKQNKKFKLLYKNPDEMDFSGLKAADIKKIKEMFQSCNPVLINTELQNKMKPLYVNTYFTDNQNILWQGILSAGSLSTGLTRSIPTNNFFRHYFFELNPEAGLNAIFPVVKDKFGTIWAGPTNVNKLFRFDSNGNTALVTPTDDATWKIARQPRALLEDSAGIWIGYYNDLLVRYDFNSNSFKKEILKTTGQNDRSLPRNLVHLEKVGDIIYIFGYSDIGKFNTRTKELKTIKSFDLNDKLTIHSVCSDNNGGWWVGMSYSTIIHFDNNFNETVRFKFGSGLFNTEDIIEGDNNNLWISQLGGGLIHFEKSTGKSKIYTTADGLSNNTCYGLLKDQHGNIWVSTNHGISRFNPETEKFRIFGPEDGLKIDEFNSDNTYMAPDGEMFFAGMGGVVSFYPDSLSDAGLSAAAYPLVITDFKVSGTPRYFKNAIYDCDSIQLEKGENNFQLTFACLDFSNAEKIQYRYRLHGEKEVFTETNHRNRSVNYSNLSPGIYRFEVEATNRNGEWAAKTALVIKILPYYYQTWWFRLSIAMLLIAVTSYFVFMYNRQIRLKAMQQQDELKLESLRSQMNPHFIFNSLNSINYFISQNDRLSANRYIADFSRLIRAILGNLSQEYIPLAKELESLNDYLQLEHLRFSNKFDYEIIVDENLDPANYLVFPGMVQPFIENAIWHGLRGLENRKGWVRIRFIQGPDCLQALVEDDGVGRKLAEAKKSSLPGKTSRGIGIVLERLKIVNHLRKTNYHVIIEDLYPDAEETGTRVTVDIPVKKYKLPL